MSSIKLTADVSQKTKNALRYVHNYSDFILDLRNQIEKSELSVYSKRTIFTVLNKLAQTNAKTFTANVLQLNKETVNVNSKKTIFGVVSSLRKQTNLESKLKPEELTILTKLYEINSIVAEKQNKKTEANEKQNKRYIEYKLLTQATEESKSITEYERMVYALYTYQPPLRLDYNDIRIINNDDTKNSETNYYILDTNEFLINEYKTASKKQEPITFFAPKALQKLILKSISENPRTVLVYNSNKNLNSPLTPQALGIMIQNISEKLFNVRVSVSDIRHSFVASTHGETDTTDIDSIEKLYRNAKQMGHSVSIAATVYHKNYTTD